jgi:Bacterial Ig-like domain (group 3)
MIRMQGGPSDAQCPRMLARLRCDGVVLAGSAVIDTAVVTKAPGAVAPTGSIRFILCQPTDVTTAGCPSPAGSKIGADIPLVNNGATSNPTGNTAPLGKYCWRARYLGDANYNPANHTNSTTECFTTQ